MYLAIAYCAAVLGSLACRLIRDHLHVKHDHDTKAVASGQIRRPEADGRGFRGACPWIP